MNNFNKFLGSSEELKMVFQSKKNSVELYFMALLFLLSFFLLFPVIKFGFQSLILWIFWLFFLIVLTSKKALKQKDLYLLTNIRLIHLLAISKESFRIGDYIRLADVSKVYKNFSSVCIVSKNKRYYISSIENKELLYKKISSYLKSQNLV